MRLTPPTCATGRYSYFKGLGARYFLPWGGLPANGRKVTIQPFPYVPIRDLKLKDKVSGKYDKERQSTCLTEMALLLACYKENDFADAPCAAEANAMALCSQKSREEMAAKKARDKTGDMNIGSRQLNHRQINTLLRKHPQPIDGIRRN